MGSPGHPKIPVDENQVLAPQSETMGSHLYRGIIIGILRWISQRLQPGYTQTSKYMQTRIPRKSKQLRFWAGVPTQPQVEVKNRCGHIEAHSELRSEFPSCLAGSLANSANTSQISIIPQSHRSIKKIMRARTQIYIHTHTQAVKFRQILRMSISNSEQQVKRCLPKSASCSRDLCIDWLHENGHVMEVV